MVSGCCEGTVLWQQLDKSRSQVTSLSVDHNGMAAHLTRSDYEGDLKSAVYHMQWLDCLMIRCGMTVERSGMAAASGMKMKELILKMDNLQTMKMVRVTLTGKGLGTLTRFVYQLYEINRNFFFVAAIFLQGLTLIQIHFFR
jgi:hypothetical protein